VELRFIVFTIVILQKKPIGFSSGCHQEAIGVEDGCLGGIQALDVGSGNGSNTRACPPQEARTRDTRAASQDLSSEGAEGRTQRRHLTEGEKDALCSKTGQRVANVLESKHPPTRDPESDALHTYGSIPEFIDVDDVTKKRSR
jgi:hypothetical protein